MQELKGMRKIHRKCYLSQRSPFTAETALRNIATGVTAPPHVNVHESKSIVNHILASTEGNPVASYIFRKKDQTVTKDTKPTIKIQDEYVHVDPQLLFQRLLTVGTKNGELQNVFDNELCHSPQLCLSQSMQFDQPQNPVWQMRCGVLRLQYFLDHLKQFNMS